jgi:hypothetical protein
LSISQDKWTKGVKSQKKDSLFVKKLSHAAYGHEGLKCRTLSLPGKNHKNKKIATPQKVASITG